MPLPPASLPRLDLSKMQQPLVRPGSLSARAGFSGRGPLSAKLGLSSRAPAIEGQLTARILQAQEGARKGQNLAKDENAALNYDESVFAMHSAMEHAAEAMKRYGLELADVREQKRDLELQLQGLQDRFNSMQNRIDEFLAKSLAHSIPQGFDDLDYDLKFDLVTQVPQDQSKLLVDFFDRIDRGRGEIQKEREHHRAQIDDFRNLLCELRDECKGADTLGTPISAGVCHAFGQPLPSFRLIHDSSTCIPDDLSRIKDVIDEEHIEDAIDEEFQKWGISDDGDQDAGATLSDQKPCTRLLFQVKQAESMEQDVELFINSIYDVLNNEFANPVAVTFDLSKVEVPSHVFLVMIAEWCRDAVEEFPQKLAVVTVILSDSWWSRALWSSFWALMLSTSPPACPFTIVYSAADANDFITSHALADQPNNAD